MNKTIERKSMYDTVMQQFNKTADAINLDPEIRKILEVTTNEIVVHFPVKLDTGKIKIFTGAT